MKKVLITILAFVGFSTASFAASVTAAPNGLGAPPNHNPGVRTTGGACAYGGCLEMLIQPRCFGTNLRAYSSATQMNDYEDLITQFTMKDKAGNTDVIELTYPASLTYDNRGVRRDCTVTTSNPQQGDTVDLYCIKAGTTQRSYYEIENWKNDKNPTCYANGGSHGQEYCDYAGIKLTGFHSGGVANDAEINCIYSFDSSRRIDSSRVRCFFPSQLQDEKDAVKVVVNGNDVTSGTEKTAIINDISAQLNSNLATVQYSSTIRNGKTTQATENVPEVAVKFFQGPSRREIAAIVERMGFDKANDNKSFTLAVKHPGVEGFCGGFYSPLMLFFNRKLPKFSGMSAFPLYGVKPGERVHWPEKDAPGYFLVDLKGKNRVESADQLFGQNKEYMHGFDALAIHDDNKDGVIDDKDKIFKRLKLWNDKNANGLSDKGEMVDLAAMNVVSIDLDFNTRKPSSFGQRAKAREKSFFTFKRKGKVNRGDVFDVWLSPVK